MAIAAKISPSELTAQVTNRFVGKHYECRLIYAPGTSYTPGTTVDATFLGFEVTAGTGGYVRQVIKYIGGDVSGYSDDGVALSTKATVFTHDGGATPIQFSHAALVEASGSITALGAVSAKPTAGVNGTYTNLPTITVGSGKGATVNLTVTNNGASTSDWVITLNKPGYGYAATNALQVTQSALTSAGAITTGTGSLDTSVSTVYTSSNQLLSVAQTDGTITLDSGNEVIFYWNLKQFGYYTV
jgi:hypothetical protein